MNPHKKPVLQPSWEWESGQSGLSLNLWSSISFVDKELNEFDLTLSYGRSINENLSLTAGLIHYAWYFTENFKFKDDTSHEVFVSLGLPRLPLEPSITLFYDFTVGDGFYVQADASYALPLLDRLEAEIHTSLGYNGGQWLAEGTDPGFSDLNFGLSLAWQAGRLKASADVNYTFVLLEAISPEDHFWFGVSVGFVGKESGQ